MSFIKHEASYMGCVFDGGVSFCDLPADEQVFAVLDAIEQGEEGFFLRHTKSTPGCLHDEVAQDLSHSYHNDK